MKLVARFDLVGVAQVEVEGEVAATNANGIDCDLLSSCGLAVRESSVPLGLTPTPPPSWRKTADIVDWMGVAGEWERHCEIKIGEKETESGAVQQQTEKER